MPAALQVDWSAIRTAAEHSMDDVELSQTFGVSRAAIRQRRFRDAKAGKPWLTPKEIKAQASLQEAKEKAKLRLKFTGNSAKKHQHSAPALQDAEDEGVTVVTAAEPLADRLIRNGELGSSWAQDLLLELLGAARRDPNKIAPLSDVKDIVSALTGVRKAAGMDKPAALLQLNFGTGWKQPKSPEDVSEEA